MCLRDNMILEENIKVNKLCCHDLWRIGRNKKGRKQTVRNRRVTLKHICNSFMCLYKHVCMYVKEKSEVGVKA